jgi:AcrR family transcriptional regulator
VPGNEPVVAPAGDGTTSFRDAAVARAVDPARLRAERRVQRFLDAALELMTSASEKDFTVQEVVERSGQSLRSFYQYFAGKYELLLALFEESVRSTADLLQERIQDEPDPFEQLHIFTVEYFRLCMPAPKGASAAKGARAAKVPAAALAEFAQQLLTEHPKEAARAFVPLVSRYVELLDKAAAAGRVRSGLSHRRIAGVVLQAIMFNAFSTTISGSPTAAEGATDPAEELWDVLVRGIGDHPGGPAAAPARR